MTVDLSKFACPRPDCPDYQEYDRGNLRRHGTYGPKKVHQIHCRSCKHTFSEKRNFPLYPVRLPPDQVVRILEGLSSKESIRGVAEKEGVDKMTVQGIVKLAEERTAPLRSWMVDEQKVRKQVVSDIIHFLRHRDELKRKNRYA